MSDRSTSRAPLAVLGVVVLGLGLWAVVRSGADGAGDRAGPDGPVRVSGKGARAQPSIDGELRFDPAGPSGAATVGPGEVASDDGPGGDRAAAGATSSPPGGGRAPPPTSNPNDLEVIGVAPERPAVDERTSALAPPAVPAVGVPGRAGKPSDTGVAVGGGPGPVVLGTTSARTKPPVREPDVIEVGLPKDVIRRFIRRSMAPIQACYEQALRTQPTLEGTVQVVFVIGTDGAVVSATGTGMDAAVAGCVAAVIRGIQFPRPDGHGAVNVRYPFAFRPVAR